MSFFDRIGQIDDSIASGASKENVKQLRALLLEFASTRYAFDRFDITWFSFLREEGWFREVPALQTDSRGSRFVQWPAGEYLVRIAQEEAQRIEIVDALREVLVKIPETNNPYVFDNVIKLALALPPDIASDLSFMFQSWIGRQGRLHGTDIPSLIKRLALSGKWGAALRIFRAVFSVYPDADFYKLPEEKRLLPKLLSHFDSWNYEQQMSSLLGDLAEGANESLIWVLCQLLSDAIRFSQRGLDRQGPDDLSYVWRPAVEDPTQNRHNSLEESLVSALRLTTEKLVRSHPEMFREIIFVLGTQQWYVFTRLSLHLLRVCEAVPLDLIRDYLTSEAHFHETTVRHEYALLLKARFRQLEISDQMKVIRLIEKGPDIYNYVQRRQQWAGQPPTQSEIDRAIKQWQFDWLSFIHDSLDLQWKSYYLKLAESFQSSPTAAHPVHFTGGAVSLSSPATSEELAAKSVPDLVEYLSNWQPDDSNWDGPSRQGLASTVTQIVVQNPNQYAIAAHNFENLAPEYVRSFIDGFAEAAKRKLSFPWENILELCSSVADHEDEQSRDRGVVFGKDPHWNWTKRSAVSLLQQGFEKEGNSIPFGLRVKAFSALKKFVFIREIDFEEQQGQQEWSSDPVTSSINTIQGTALHAAIRYAFWVRENDPQFKGMSSMEELAELLDQRLQADEQSPLSTRAVFGQWFPWLVSLDEQWISARIDKIFPDEPRQDKSWQAAWTAYIGYCGAFDKVLEVLKPKYEKAVKEINREWQVGTYNVNPSERLAEHLMTFYWRSKIDLNEGGLIHQLIMNGTATVRQKCLEFVGRSLDNTEEVPDSILKRLQFFFDWLTQRDAAESEICSEFAAFGWWFVSEKFEDNWRISSLHTSLQLAKDTEPADKVLEELEKLAGTFPKEAAECVALLAIGEHEPWEFEFWSSHAYKILEISSRAGGQKSRSAVEDAANLFGKSGYLKFRDFIHA